MIKLEKDPRWNVYEKKTKSIDDFEKNNLPDLYIKKTVPKDVKKSIRVLYKLLVLSYYEYELVDIAVTKTLNIFEMALKIRFKELNGEDWNSKRPLKALIEWFQEGGYFEISHPPYFEHIRKARNYFSHPERHSFGGIAVFHLIREPIDLINDLYEDRKLRINRLEAVQKIGDKLSPFITNGAYIEFGGTKYIIYKLYIIFVNNKDQPNIIHALLPPIYRYPKDELSNYPSPILIEFNEYRIMSSKILLLQRGKEIASLRQLKSNDDKTRFNSWLNEFNNDDERYDYIATTNLSIEKYYKEVRRNFNSL